MSTFLKVPFLFSNKSGSQLLLSDWFTQALSVKASDLVKAILISLESFVLPEPYVRYVSYVSLSSHDDLQSNKV